MIIRTHVSLAGTALGLIMSTHALAQSGADGLGSEIVVTARRVEERLQDVPISMTIFSQEQIAERNIVTASDLGIYTPSLSTNTRFGADKASFAIRGFSQDPATSPSVGVYFAEVVAPRSAGATTGGSGSGPGQLFDLQNIQVLKGPQGKLFGRNTTGCAILLVPKRPTDRLRGMWKARSATMTSAVSEQCSTSRWRTRSGFVSASTATNATAISRTVRAVAPGTSPI